MSGANIWRILAIKETSNLDLIKEAYREKLAHANPEDDPEAFMELRQAYEDAIRISSQDLEEDDTEKTDIDLWIDNIKEIYSDLRTRRDPNAWNSLLNHELCNSLDTWEQVRESLLIFLIDFYFLPHPIFVLIDDKFEILKDIEKLKQTFNNNFIDYIANRIADPLNNLDFNLFFLTKDYDPSFDNADEYISFFYQTETMMNNNDIDKLETEIKKANEFNIYSPYFDVTMLRYYMAKNQHDQVNIFLDKLKDYDNDIYINYYIGTTYHFLNKFDQAQNIWLKIIDVYPDHYGAKVGMVEYFFETNQLKKANEEVLVIMEQYRYSSDLLKLLNKINESLIIQYEEEIKINPNNYEAKKELAWCYYQNKYYDKALLLLSKFPKSFFKELWYAKLHGYIYISQDDFDKALQYFTTFYDEFYENKINDKNHKDYLKNIYQSNFMLGCTLNSLKRYEESIQYLQVAIQYGKNIFDRLETRSSLAFSYLSLNMNEKTIEECDKIIHEVPNYLQAFLYKQKAYYNLKNGSEVINLYYDIIQKFPDIETVEAHLLAAKIFYFWEEYDNSMEIIIKAREIDEKNNKVELFYGKILCKKADNNNDKQKAISFLNLLVENISDPIEKAHALDSIAKIYLDLEWYDEGFITINHALKILPTNNAFLETKANLYYFSDHYEKALKYFKDLIKVNENSFSFNYKLAYTYNALNNKHDSIIHFTKALDISPDSKSTLLFLVRLYCDLYRDEEKYLYYKLALPYISKLDESEDSFDKFFRIGLFYGSNREFEKSIKYYNEAKKHDLEDPWTYNNASFMLFCLNKIDEAKAEAKKAIELLDNNVDVANVAFIPYENLANCYEFLHEYDKAFACYENFLSTYPNNFLAKDNIGKIYVEMHDYHKAIKYYKSLAKKHKDDIITCYIRLINIYDIQGDSKNLKKYCYKLFALKTLLTPATYYYENGWLFMGEKFALQTIKTNANNHILQIDAHIKLAQIQDERDKYHKAKLTAKKALDLIVKYHESIDNYLAYAPLAASRYYDIGELNKILDNFKQAEYHYKAIQNQLKCKNCIYKECYKYHLGMASLYERQKDYKNAIKYYQETIEHSFSQCSLSKRRLKAIKNKYKI